jgi:hypothetical protein
MPTPLRTAPIVQKSAPQRHDITDPRIQVKQSLSGGQDDGDLDERQFVHWSRRPSPIPSVVAGSRSDRLIGHFTHGLGKFSGPILDSHGSITAFRVSAARL